MKQPGIIKAEYMGFCMGVDRALKLVEEALADPAAPRPVGTLGPLIHNKRVIAALQEKGVIIYDPDQLPENGTVVIRAHGIPREQQQALERNPALHVINGTCPRVTANQQLVKRWNNEGRPVMIIGDKNHGEIVSLASYADKCAVFLDPEEIREEKWPCPCAVLAQTTLKESEWQAAAAAIREKCPEALLRKTICDATRKRQEALEDLTARVDAVIVIGGTMSANTRRLYEKVVAAGKPAWHVVGASSFTDEDHKTIRAFSSIGITAGASTPAWIIDEVVEALTT